MTANDDEVQSAHTPATRPPDIFRFFRSNQLALRGRTGNHFNERGLTRRYSEQPREAE